MEQDDVVGHLKLSTELMPAGAVANESGTSAMADLGADLLEMQVHALGVGSGGDHRGSRAAYGADRAEQVGSVVTIVAHHQRPRADRSPDIGMRALLSDSGFVLIPYLYRCSGSGAKQGFLQQNAETLLKSSSASGSFLG